MLVICHSLGLILNFLVMAQNYWQADCLYECWNKQISREMQEKNPEKEGSVYLTYKHIGYIYLIYNILSKYKTNEFWENGFFKAGKLQWLFLKWMKFLCLKDQHSLLLRLHCKEYNQSDFYIDRLVMSMCRVFSCVVGSEFLLWPVCSLGKTLLAFTLFHSVLQGQIHLLLQVSLDFLLLLFSHLYWKGLKLWIVYYFSLYLPILHPV